jgi:cell fate regulator YaaT (PSP1 superfamily)
MSVQPEFLNQPPFRGKRRLYNVVSIEFRTSFLKRDVDARELMLHPGDEVVVDTLRGPAIAMVRSPVHRKVMPPDQMMSVLRKATEQDARQQVSNEELEKQAYAAAISRIRDRDLDMKLVRVQVMQDGSRIVFYFSSEGRIDFRDLVKDLAHGFRTRIEMHQIGVRDGTRMIGGIGPCGRELCCSTFLEDFAPVSIRMAKDQGLTLNPAKVSGMCGRLMCCLVYEQAVYRRMKKGLPRAGRMVETPEGLAKVYEVDVINERVSVVLEDMNRKTFRAVDVKYHDPKAQVETVDESDDDDVVDYVWEDLAGQVITPERERERERPRSDDGQAKKSRRRRRKKPAGDGGSNQADAKTSQPRNDRQQPKTFVPEKSGDRKPTAKAGAKPQGGDKPKPAADKPNQVAKPNPDGKPQDGNTSTEGGEPRRRRRRSRRRNPQGGGSDSGGSPSDS